MPAAAWRPPTDATFGIGCHRRIPRNTDLDDPNAINQMLSHSWTVMIGRSDMEVPGPRNIDWVKESVFS